MKKYYFLFQIFGNNTSDTISTNYIFSKVALLIFIMVLLSAEFTSAQSFNSVTNLNNNNNSTKSGPEITVWYGDEQSFGQHGLPQPWVNILGNVSNPEDVDELYYTLNGGPNVILNIGPDSRRLQSSGDFNIDLATDDLIAGDNDIIITATYNLDNQTVYPVTVNYTSTNIWPLPYDIDWQDKAAINEVSQVVDGNWEITPGGIHTVTTGYDRLVAIGDMIWDDYEITVPITIHSIGGGGGIGVLLRWMGHTDDPVSGWQPKSGWLPLGAICWYRGNRLEIYGNDGDILATQTRSLDLETIYIFKTRVETNPGVGGKYSFKVWKQIETEPDGWDITGQETLTDPQNGSSMLISHHGDVTFGNVFVSPIPISITNVQALVHSGNTAATISWNTSELGNSQVAYGLTSEYLLGSVTDPTLETSHSLDLTALLPNTEYHYQITSITAAADEAVTGDLTFTTVTSDIVSDDFHLPLLNTSLWTFIDPVGDCSYDLVGSNTADAWLNFNVPAGTEHQLWTSGLKVPHVRQSCNNADFEVEVKFESPLNLKYQEQGILVRQNDDIFLRFEFFSDDTKIRAYAASLVSGSANTYADVNIGSPGMAPLYMRVKRQNDQWTMSYSTDGSTWNQSAFFTFDMTVTGIGPYAGNAIGGSSPAHTGSIDYFFNTDEPVVPEDPVSGEVVIITSTPMTTAAVGQLYTYDTDATGTPAPTYMLLTFPEGMTINVTSGLIEWTPTVYGYFDVSVKASNTIPYEDIQNFVIHVPDISGGPVSDDFNDPILDETVWSFIDPLGDGGYTLTGSCTDDAWINISVPAGSPHELWINGITAPHILQPSGDTDFELEVKFESSVSGTYQEQGILVKQDDANFIRFEFYSNGAHTYVIAVTFIGTPGVFPLTKVIKFNGSIGTSIAAPIYMRVNRTGNQWTQSYSTDGIDWPTAASFTHTLSVSAVGTYVGNAGDSPAHTSSVDYFFNTASPVLPEDGPCTQITWTGAIDNDWNNNDNWSLGTPDQSSIVLIPDLSSSKNVSPEISGSANCFNLTIESGATLDIGVNGMLTVYGTFLNNGGTTIHSNETGTGSFIDNGFISGSGTINVERYLFDNRWHYISAPVDDPTAQVFLGMYMMEWDEPSGEWSFITDPNYVMSTDMQGFAIWTYDPGLVTFVGNLNSGSKSFSTTNSFEASHANKGFNFSGNPYPSALNWNVDDGKGWSRTAGNIDPSIYIWNNSIGNYGVYVKDGITGTNGVDNIIPPHQGFYIHCSAATGYIDVDNRARIHTSKDILKKGNTDSTPTIILGVSGNNFSDETIIQIDDRASINYDIQFDALKYRGSEDAPQLYSILPDNQPLSINSFPENDAYTNIPLGLEVGIEAIYTIMVNDIDGFVSTDNIFLEDLKTRIFTKLETKSSYNFTSGPDDESLRFILHLNMETPEPQNKNELIYTYSFNKNIYVTAPLHTTGSIIIHDIMGQEISRTEINGIKTIVPLEKSACYVVKVISNKGVVTDKVIVK